MIRLGPLAIHWYGVMVAAGFLATTAAWNWLAKQDRRRHGFGIDFATLVMFSGIIGARIAYIIANWSDYREHPASVFRVDQGGLIFYGGFIAACLVVLVMALRKGEPVLSLGDFGITALPLGHALGRIGCFLNGCCYGSPSDLPWCTYAAGAMRHPVQLYEAAFNFALFALLVWFYPRRKRNGWSLALYLTTYPVWRFLIEFLRGDERLSAGLLDTAQVISLGLFAIGVLLWIMAPRREVPPHA